MHCSPPEGLRPFFFACVVLAVKGIPWVSRSAAAIELAQRKWQGRSQAGLAEISRPQQNLRTSSECAQHVSHEHLNFVAPHLLIHLRTSEFQARSEVISIAFNGVANVEVVNPARAKIEVALTNFG